MAKDVIARLKADTSEWDSKLSKAMQSMDRLGSDSIKMLGKMAATWLSVETAVSGIDIPFHPGATKYFTEVGAM